MVPPQQRSSPSSCFLVDIADNALVIVSVSGSGWVWLINSVEIVDEGWVKPMVEGDRVGKLVWVEVSSDTLEAVSGRRYVLWVGGVVVIVIGGAGDHHGSHTGREEDMWREKEGEFIMHRGLVLRKRGNVCK